MEFKDNVYESDLHLEGISYFNLQNSWAYSSTGLPFTNDDSSTFLTPNLTLLDSNCPKYCQTVRRSSLSLKYYDLCMMEGNYTVKLHFAEIMLSDDHTYSILVDAYLTFPFK